MREVSTAILSKAMMEVNAGMLFIEAGDDSFDDRLLCGPVDYDLAFFLRSIENGFLALLLRHFRQRCVTSSADAAKAELSKPVKKRSTTETAIAMRKVTVSCRLTILRPSSRFLNTCL
jgi:hypothetical protein